MDTRPVWVSEEHADYIDRYLGGFKARWDVAPADATEAVRQAISPWVYGAHQEVERNNCVETVLAALKAFE